MTEYVVKICFWLHAHDGFTLEADTDAEAIEKAKAAAAVAMEATTLPEHIELEARREGVIAYVDRITSDGREVVSENIEFDEDRIRPLPAA